METLSTFVAQLKKFTETFSQDTTPPDVPHKQYSKDAAALEKLESDLKAGSTTYTLAIATVYRSNQERQSTLVDTTRKLASQRHLEKDSKKREQLTAQYEESKATMKQTRKFNKFAESVVPRDTLQNKPNVLSSPKTQNNDQMWTYEKSNSEGYEIFENTLDSDRAAYMSGTGISLNPRLEGERVDPQHRAWGTQYPPTRHALKPIHDAWSGGKLHPDEDLPVAVALSNKEGEVAIKNKYFTPQEAMCSIASSNNGFLQDCDGNKLDTNNKLYIFVMDMQGNLFVHPDDTYSQEADGTERRIGHPAFVQGGPVACAGELKIVDGKITEISNTSGHYSPKIYSLFRVVSSLNTRGVLSDQLRIVNMGDEKLEFNKNTPSLSTIKCLNTDAVEVPAPNAYLDLSEKHNPLKLFESLTKVNLYLKDRAEETSFFGYSGKEYDTRKEHFQSVLAKLSWGKHQEALNLINEGIEKFDGTFSKSRYSSCLEELRDSLTSKDALLNNPFVQERVGAYRVVYEAMNSYTSAVSEFDKGYSLGSDNSQTLATIAERNIQYLAERKKFAEIKKEFPNEKKLHDVAYKNTVHR